MTIRILAIFSRAKPQPAPVKWVGPKPWTRLGKRLVSIHISDASRK